ncbi:hypothetical protein A2335_02655 [Candidatus Peregrinibacteria bacterium RIFOXYB2_FULL_32_7]|nr:MAG: hypothetical protein A2335_02655 [Candidatus Peregrinibacteria bacterium RIFOXYB2_FULL_32_7]
MSREGDRAEIGAQRFISDYVNSLSRAYKSTDCRVLYDEAVVATNILDLTPNLPSHISINRVETIMTSFGIPLDNHLMMMSIIREWVRLKYLNITLQNLAFEDNELYSEIEKLRMQYGLRSIFRYVWRESPEIGPIYTRSDTRIRGLIFRTMELNRLHEFETDPSLKTGYRNEIQTIYQELASLLLAQNSNLLNKEGLNDEDISNIIYNSEFIRLKSLPFPNDLVSVIRSAHQEQVGKKREEERLAEQQRKDAREKPYREFLDQKSSLLEFAPLSADNFERLFLEEDSVFQLKFPNCFLVAAFKSLSYFPHFDFIIRNAMKVNIERKWLGLQKTDYWEVRIPLLDPNGKWITVKEKDLSGDGDDRKGDESVGGGKGYKILEAALLISKYGKADRSEIKGGFGHHVLIDLLGKKYIEKELITEGENKFHNPLNTRAYNQATRFLPDVDDESSQHSQEVLDVIQFFNQFDPRYDIATTNTPRKREQQSEFISVTDVNSKEVQLIRQHAYSVIKLDHHDDTVSVIDPGDNDNIITLSYPVFLSGFAQISGVKINYEEWLKN